MNISYYSRVSIYFIIIKGINFGNRPDGINP